MVVGIPYVSVGADQHGRHRYRRRHGCQTCRCRAQDLEKVEEIAYAEGKHPDEV